MWQTTRYCVSIYITIHLHFFSVLLYDFFITMEEVSGSKPVFTLSVAAEILSVHPRTLMIYETESLVVPLRTKTNRRRYSQNDLKKLQFVRYLTTIKGINLAGVESILSMLRSSEKNGIDLQKLCFPDFSEQELV